MDEPGDIQNTEFPPEVNGPGGSPEQRLREQLAEGIRLLTLAEAEGKRAGPAAFRLLEKYRGPFAEVAAGFGEALADFLEVDRVDHALFDHPAFLEQIGPLYHYLRAVPLFRSVEDLSLGLVQDGDQIERTLLLDSPSGFDLPSALLSDFYRRSAVVRSFQRRAAAMGEWIRAEVRTRAVSQEQPVRLLRLLCGSGLEGDIVLADPICAKNMAVMCVDQHLHALRRARRVLTQQLTHKPRFLRADPLELDVHPNRPRERFEVVYTLTLFDTLTPSQAVRMVRICHDLLEPGGVLLTGGYTTDLPRSEKAIVARLAWVQLQYLDEEGWRRLLRTAPFDLDGTRLERQDPAAILIAARRAGEPQENER